MVMRSDGDEDATIAESYPDETRNTCLFVEVRRVDHGDADRDRKFAKFVEHPDCGVLAATDDRYDHQQVDVRVGAVITTSNLSIQDDFAGTASLDNAVRDS